MWTDEVVSGYGEGAEGPSSLDHWAGLPEKVRFTRTIEGWRGHELGQRQGCRIEGQKVFFCWRTENKREQELV